jgi:hypothetical protein
MAALDIFLSQTFPAESCYSIFDSELLAAYLAVRQVRFFLKGCQFMLFTDHEPLVTTISKSGTPFSSRQQRHLSFLSEFSISFSHLPGPRNVVADALSRPSSPVPPVHAVTTAPASLFPLPLSYLDLAATQAHCSSTSPLKSLPSLKIVPIPLSPTVSLLGDVSTSTFRPLVPHSFGQQIFQHLHSLGHPDTRSTCHPITSHFLWEGMAKDINLWTKQCLPCQTSKIHTHVSLPPVPIPIPSCRFSHIHVDLVGPLPLSQGHTHILIIVDRTIR